MPASSDDQRPEAVVAFEDAARTLGLTAGALFRLALNHGARLLISRRDVDRLLRFKRLVDRQDSEQRTHQPPPKSWGRP